MVGDQIKRPRFDPWRETLCCVLGQDTLTVALSSQVYKWVSVLHNTGGNLLGGLPYKKYGGARCTF